MDEINILTIDTSSNDLKIGLSIDGKDAYSILDKNTTQIEALIPNIQKCLDRIKKDKKDLHYVAVCVGPGSFTGIRIGVSAATAVAYARNIKCFGFSVFDIYKYMFKDLNDKVIIPLIDAKKDRYYCSFIEVDKPIEMFDIGINDIVRKIKEHYLDRKIVFVGKDVQYIAEELEKHIDFEVRYENGYGPLDILSYTMNFAYNNSEFLPPKPIYLRKSEAEIALLNNQL